MKTERRHELGTNELALRLTAWIEKIKPYSTPILVGVIGAAVLYFGYQFFSGQSRAQTAAAWTAYYDAVQSNDPAKLNSVAEQYADAPASQWAEMAVADIQMGRGMALLFLNRQQAHEQLNKAGGAYRKLQNEGRHDLLRERAAFMRACVLEAQGDLDEAKKAYGQVSGMFEQTAKQRIESLGKKDTKEFYNWFASAEPAQVPTTTGPGVPGMRTEFAPDPITGFDGGLSPGFGLGDESAPPPPIPPISPGDSSNPTDSPLDTGGGEPGVSLEDLFPTTDEPPAKAAETPSKGTEPLTKSADGPAKSEPDKSGEASP